MEEQDAHFRHFIVLYKTRMHYKQSISYVPYMGMKPRKKSSVKIDLS